jgi:hypothetical protein
MALFSFSLCMTTPVSRVFEKNWNGKGRKVRSGKARTKGMEVRTEGGNGDGEETEGMERNGRNGTDESKERNVRK